MLKGFRDFILRGNVVDLAVAFMMGAAFNAVVTSLVNDVISKLIGATVGTADYKAFILHVGKGEIMIGSFFSAVINFLIVAGVVYFAIVLPMNTIAARLKKPVAAAEPTTKTCPECLSEIPLAARRCAHCAQPVGS
jgi:large conductance mechanosensitive channel